MKRNFVPPVSVVKDEIQVDSIKNVESHRHVDTRHAQQTPTERPSLPQQPFRSYPRSFRKYGGYFFTDKCFSGGALATGLGRPNVSTSTVQINVNPTHPDTPGQLLAGGNMDINWLQIDCVKMSILLFICVVICITTIVLMHLFAPKLKRKNSFRVLKW